jgi:hypothetical protein
LRENKGVGKGEFLFENIDIWKWIKHYLNLLDEEFNYEKMSFICEKLFIYLDKIILEYKKIDELNKE